MSDKTSPRQRAATASPAWLTLLAVGLGLSLNQSSTALLRINLSYADGFLLVLLLALAFSGLVVPLKELLFFLLVSMVGLVVAFFVTPAWSGAPVDARAAVAGWVKLVTSFGYLLLGYNLLSRGEAKRVFQAFYTGAVAIGSLSLLAMAVPALSSSRLLFYGGYRFRGLMNDPNYFAILQVCALACLWLDSAVKWPAKLVFGSILATSVLLSGSKTGAVVLLAWVVLQVARLALANGTRPPPRNVLLVGVIVVAAAFGAFALLDPGVSQRVASLLEQVPALNRLTPLFLDFDSAVQQDGSGRTVTWASALHLVSISPLIGVGIGAANATSRALTGTTGIAHNTYLQLAAEWGLPLMLVFFTWVGSVLVKARQVASPAARMASACVVLMLVGSLSISLNNARLFWLGLGVVAAAVNAATTSRDIETGLAKPKPSQPLGAQPK